MQIKLVYKPVQSESTPPEDIQYLGEKWIVDSRRFMTGIQFEDYNKKREIDGYSIMYLYDMRWVEENIYDGRDENGKDISHKQMILWVRADYKRSKTSSIFEQIKYEVLTPYGFDITAVMYDPIGFYSYRIITHLSHTGKTFKFLPKHIEDIYGPQSYIDIVAVLKEKMCEVFGSEIFKPDNMIEKTSVEWQATIPENTK